MQTNIYSIMYHFKTCGGGKQSKTSDILRGYLNVVVLLSSISILDSGTATYCDWWIWSHQGFDLLTESRGKKRELRTGFPRDGTSLKRSVLSARRGSALRNTFFTAIHVVARLVAATARGDESSPSALGNTLPLSRFKMR